MNNKDRSYLLHDLIVNAFQEQSGGDYNDTMYYQAMGAVEEIAEAEDDNTDEDWAYCKKTLTECWKYVKHCAKIDKMQNEMPNEIYG